MPKTINLAWVIPFRYDRRMNLRQLRYFSEVAKNGMSITKAADALNTSQPGVSKQLRLVEDELGGAVFVRTSHRLLALTPVGARIIALARQAITATEAIRSVARAEAEMDVGELRVATTHAHARYFLPRVLRK